MIDLTQLHIILLHMYTMTLMLLTTCAGRKAAGTSGSNRSATQTLTRSGSTAPKDKKKSEGEKLPQSSVKRNEEPQASKQDDVKLPKSKDKVKPPEEDAQEEMPISADQLALLAEAQQMEHRKNPYDDFGPAVMSKGGTKIKAQGASKPSELKMRQIATATPI
ncbi:hypothetical protein Q1695_012474 [Nippostrongylus brasiliensis]|nr:hypothetical protein Q1695_012474 [Nippostrongylus brasiliensis]